MAYLQSRSNIARSGVTHCGWSPTAFTFKVGGTTRNIQHNQRSRFSITEQLGQPGRMSFDAYGYTPTLGQTVQFLWTTPDAYQFAGTVTRRRMRLDKSNLPVWQCEAQDNSGWLMNRVAKVTAQYRNRGANTILALILDTFTDGGFKVGYCPSSLGDVSSINFENEDVSQAIEKLAATVGAYWLVDAEKRVYMFDTLPDGNSLSIGNSSDVRLFDYDDDLTQLRNRTTVIGEGSTVAARAAAGATTLSVQDTTPFTSTGGQAMAERNVITYTGYTVASGPGDLTGCSGITTDVPEGARIRVYRQANDTTAQTAMATLLGGGLSGVVAHVMPDDGLTDNECALLAAEDIASFATAPSGVEYDTVDRVSLIGKVVAVNVTAPITVLGDYRIQSVTMTPKVVSGTDMSFSRRVNARVFQQQIASLFRKVA